MGSPTLGPSPGNKQHPKHTILISKSPFHWYVSLGQRSLAESCDAYVLEEAEYPPVIYFPQKDVSIELMQPSSTQTTCPFKGKAHYYAATIENELADVAWYYPEVYDEVAEIAGLIAFDLNKVKLTGISQYD